MRVFAEQLAKQVNVSRHQQLVNLIKEVAPTLYYSGYDTFLKEKAGIIVKVSVNYHPIDNTPLRDVAFDFDPAKLNQFAEEILENNPDEATLTKEIIENYLHLMNPNLQR